MFIVKKTRNLTSINHQNAKNNKTYNKKQL